MLELVVGSFHPKIPRVNRKQFRSHAFPADNLSTSSWFMNKLTHNNGFIQSVKVSLIPGESEMRKIYLQHG